MSKNCAYTRENFNKNNFIRPQNGYVHKMFEERVAEFSDKIAVECGDKKVSYGELDELANAISGIIGGARHGNQQMVYVYMDRGIDMVVSILGTLKSGNIFIPMDPCQPHERTKDMFKRVKPGWIIAGREYSGEVKRIFGRKPGATTDHEGLVLLDYSTMKRRHLTEPRHAYINFTSGTTGRPKAVLGPNNSLAQFIEWQIEEFNITEDYRTSQFIACLFTGFLRDIFIPLCAGGTLCIPPDSNIVFSPQMLAGWINKNRIALVQCSPTVFRIIAEGTMKAALPLKHLKYVITSGEKLVVDKYLSYFVKKFDHRVTLVNFYGGTEVVLTKLYHRATHKDLERSLIPIGVPVKSAQVVILDEKYRVRPPGKVGELYIKSPFMSAGYYKDEKSTNKVFIGNPLAGKKDKNKKIVYKTGDLVRALPDNTIEILGRIDDQIKIRGYRVEPGEIEARLKEVRGVKDCMVVVRQDKRRGRYLAAYYVSPSAISVQKLRKHLSAKLPLYIIPNYFMRLNKLPLAPNGKIDKSALPEITGENLIKGRYDPPKTEVEKKIARVWQDALSIRKISRRDNFFDLGGNSLEAVRVLARINKLFRTNLSFDKFFQHPTPAVLAQNISKQTKAGPRKYQKAKPARYIQK